VIRKVLLIVGVILAWMWIRAFLRRRQQPARKAAPRPASPETPRFEGEMVRDRVCETFLPKSRALVVHRDGEDWFFCSEACRSTFLEGRKAAN
jgi:YHS domain-containing protein